MNKGILAAKEIITNFNINEPNKYSLNEIICGLNGPIIKEEILQGAEGRISSTKNYSLITINSNIKSEGKKRFTLAHEFGHFQMHRKLNNYFNCDENALMSWYDNSKETEANHFAAELLMPEELFYKYSRTEKFSLEFIKHLSELFKTSVTATSLRFAEKGHDPILLVCSQAGKIRWFKRHEKFPFANIEIGKDVPSNSVIAEYINKGKIYTKPEEIEPSDWFLKSFYKELKCYEQCIIFDQFGYALSFIFISKT
jgi:Zn-dependent peptidase ImmA (M78 family)